VTALITAAVPNPLTVAKGGTGASTAAGARSSLDVFAKDEINPVVRSRILVATGFWTAGNALNGSGTPGYNGIFSQGWYLFGDTTSANWEARAVNVAGNGQHLPGLYGTIDWTKAWTARVRLCVQAPAKDNNYICLMIGTGSTPTSPTLVGKGVKVWVKGDTTANKVQLCLGAYDSAEALGTAVDWPKGTHSSGWVNLTLRFVPGTGFYVYADGSRTPLASVTSQIPTTTSTNCCTTVYGKSVTGSGTAVLACWNDIEFDHTDRY
jgi:hypothetical protein